MTSLSKAYGLGGRFSEGIDIIEEYGLEAFEINVLDPERTATEKIVSLLRYSLADDYITELRELQDLAYQNIPSEQEIKQSFIELSSQLF